MVEDRRAAVSRGDSPADVQMARSFVAVVAALVIASGALCGGVRAPGVQRLPVEIRAVAMMLGAGTATLRSTD